MLGNFAELTVIQLNHEDDETVSLIIKDTSESDTAIARIIKLKDLDGKLLLLLENCFNYILND